MKRKNGFTLIELLAVIVILAIIAVIAVPIVINIIDDSKKNSTLRSADFYLDAVELSIADRVMHHGGIDDNTYPIMSDGNICLETYDSTTKSCKDKDGKTNDDKYVLKVEVKGEYPKEGTITIVGGEILHSEIKLNEKEIIKDSKGGIAYAKTLDEVCTYVDEVTNKEEKTAGAKYKCKVDPEKPAYTFYILKTPNSTDERINLIMDQNINSDGTPAETTGVTQSDNENKYNLVSWVSKDDYNDDTNYGEGNNNKGPLTAMNSLREATKNWTNTNEISINKFFDETGKTYKMETYNTYARLPIYLTNDETEVMNKTDANAYLYENLSPNASDAPFGYWTLSAHSYYSNMAWRVNFDDTVSDYNSLVAYADYYGVRPVISLRIK